MVCIYDQITPAFLDNAMGYCFLVTGRKCVTGRKWKLELLLHDIRKVVGDVPTSVSALMEKVMCTVIDVRCVDDQCENCHRTASI